MVYFPTQNIDILIAQDLYQNNSLIMYSNMSIMWLDVKHKFKKIKK